MAWIVGDGFDYYGQKTDVARSVWDAVATDANSFILTSTTRFGVGQAIVASNPINEPWLTKNIPTNEATLFVALAFYRAGTLSGTTPETYVTFRDGATAQCTVVFETSGNIVLKSGSHTGTVLATYAAAFGQDVWTHFQVKVVISNTAGSMTVRKNGATTDSYASATNLNTRGGTANNYANVVVLGYGGSFGAAVTFDDVLLYSGSGAAPNDWVGDVRAVPLMPLADTAQKNFLSTAGGVPALCGSVTASGWLNPAAASWIYCGNRFAPARGGPISSVEVRWQSPMTGHAKGALYAADGAAQAPGTLLATSNEVTNPSGTVTLTFASPPVVSPIRAYYFAIMGDASSLVMADNGASGSIYNGARTYAAGFPNPAAGLAVSSSVIPYAQGAFVSGSNAYVVGELFATGDVDYVYDATVGDSDLYVLDTLPATPAAIIGVVSKVFIKKSDAGTRNGVVRVRSGVTDVQSADLPLSSSYTYISRVDAVDPATGVAWTPAAVNALQVGQKVTV